MKKIVSIFLVLTGVLILVACGPKKRDKDPVILGVRTTVEIEVGDDYNPLEGVTAFESDDKNAKEITKDLTTTFKEDMLLSPGEKNFSISVTNSAGRSKTENVKLIVGVRSQIVLVAPSAVTYYIGSKPFDPLEEVRAYIAGSNEEVEVEVTDEDYTTAVPGNYSYTVTAKDDKGVIAQQVIKLTVVRGDLIPNELSKNPIKIVLWHSNGTAIENQLKLYGKDFENMMKAEGYNITVEILKNGATYDELRKNVINALKGSELPNIVQNYPDHVVEYNKNGAITSLNPYINHPVWGLDKNTENDKFTDILESYRQEQRATNDNGDYLSLPFNKSTEVVVYNKTLFDAVLKGAPFPETWQELFALYPEIMKVKDQMIDQIVARRTAAGLENKAEDVQKAKDQFVPFTYDSSSNAFITLTRQFGGSYTSRDSNGKGVLEFDSQTVRNMLQLFGSKENGEIFTVPAKWEVKYANEAFPGTTALSIGSTAGVRYNTPVEEGYELYEIGVAPVPYDMYSPESKAVIQQGTNLSLTTEGNEDQKIASWLFIKYLMSEEIQSRFAIATGYSPVRNSVYTTNAKYLEYLANADKVMAKSYTEAKMTKADYQNAYELKVKAMASKVATAQRAYQFYDTPFIGSSAARDAVGVAFERVILAKPTDDLKKAIEDAIAYAIAEAKKVIG